MRKVLSLLLVLMITLPTLSQKSISKRVDEVYPGTSVIASDSSLIIEMELQTWCTVNNINIEDQRQELKQKNAIINLSEALINDLKTRKIRTRKFHYAAVLFVDKNTIYMSGHHRLK